MDIKVDSKITIKINDLELKMTSTEARLLIEKLEKELNIKKEYIPDWGYRQYSDWWYRQYPPIITCGTGTGQKPANSENYIVSSDGGDNKEKRQPSIQAIDSEKDI